MEQSVTRHDLASALIQILKAKGIADPTDALEVIGSPGNGVRLFAVVAAPRAKGPLGEALMKITGHRHLTAGDIWILDEAQSLALIELAGMRALPVPRELPPRL